jgi:hypothetical protein
MVLDGEKKESSELRCHVAYHLIPKAFSMGNSVWIDQITATFCIWASDLVPNFSPVTVDSQAQEQALDASSIKDGSEHACGDCSV